MANTNEYMKHYMASRRKKRRARLLELSGNKCQQCKSPGPLEFNHVDIASKRFTLSGASLDRPWEDIVEEWKKCELLCKECHLIHTRKLWSDGELVPVNKNLHGEYIHGTPRMYQDKKCKCEPCKESKVLYRKGIINYDGSIK